MVETRVLFKVIGVCGNCGKELRDNDDDMDCPDCTSKLRVKDDIECDNGEHYHTSCKIRHQSKY